MATEKLAIKVDEKGAVVASRNIAGIGKAATVAGGGVKLLQSALGALGIVGVGFAMSKLTATLASFSQEMSTVKAITGATGTVFDDLKMKARDLGANTRFSATQAAQGMTFLGRAGFDTNEILASIEPTLQLAQAGALDLGRAADIASNVLTGFNIEATDSQRVIDVLALAANSANTNVEQLGEAMSYVAPISATLGVSLEETAAGVQVLSDAGIQAARAGTNLTMIMRRLESPAGKQKMILKDLGLELEDVSVSQNGLTGALENLGKAGATNAQIFDLFGRNAAAASVLLKGTEGKIQDFTAANMEAAGTAKEVADIMDDNLNGAILATKSAWEELQLAFGDQGAENLLTKTFRGLADILRNVAKNIDVIAQPINDLFNFIKDVGVATFNALKPVVTAVVDQFFAWGVNNESLSMTLDDIGFALLAMLRTATQVIDGVISSFNILGKVIATSIFGGIQDAQHFWQQGLHFMTEAFKDMLNEIIREFNKLSANVGIDPIGFLLPEGAPETEAFDWGKGMGDAVRDGFISPLTGMLDQVIADVSDSQAKRKLEDFRASLQGTSGEPGSGTGPAGSSEQALVATGEETVEVIDEITKSATLMEQSVSGGFNTMTDSLVEFTQTGKLEFGSMIADMLSQMARLAASQLFGTIGGAIGIPGRAAGGSVTGGSPYFVGEKGPELMVPGASGAVVPNSQLASMLSGGGATPTVATPQVNVTIVNVTDPDEALEMMKSEEGGKVIVNQLTNNRTAAKQALA